MNNRSNVKARCALHKITPYSPGKPIWELQAERGLSSVTKLASNENPLGPSPKAMEAISLLLPDIHRYPDAGASRLRQALADKYEMNPGQFLVSNGGDELITLIAETFLDPEDEMIICSPSFSEYEFGAHLMGASVISVPLDKDFQFDMDAIIGAVTPRTRLLCLCSPNNPTGTYIPAKVLHHLLDILPDHVVVLLDAAYSQFAEAPDYTNGLEFVRAGYPLIVLQTFSKIYGLAGLRVGYGIAPEAIIQQISKVKEPFNVNMLAQAAAEAALGDEDHMHKTLAVNAYGKLQLYHAFQSLELSYIDSMSNFVLVEIGAEAKRVYEELLSRGVIVRYGGIWNLPRHIRVSVGTQEENEVFSAALKDILG
ncbi:histidinol-phosphate transaminase [Paenibacillus physcomitrellae]|uniref:Histidinol-phosphate aminotransferase n=1 Tax=Paenibacillus physcomitrellae TaxID=1619311 RepID=A0ABQ1G4Z7_9BACL|nr:histidinol-phosphate transaminase [Paenibacillus physcomitrellae]GGA36904.1 histidinol-phosphate aminotransferase [Paenibacillus physcomitrellae]